jgi:hypothetical protein
MKLSGTFLAALALPTVQGKGTFMILHWTAMASEENLCANSKTALPFIAVATKAFDGPYLTNPLPGPGNELVEWWWHQVLADEVNGILPGVEAIFYRGSSHCCFLACSIDSISWLTRQSPIAYRPHVYSQ